MDITSEVYKLIQSSLTSARGGQPLTTANAHTQNLFQRLDPGNARSRNIGDADLDYIVAEFQQIPGVEQKQVKTAIETRHMTLGVALQRRRTGGQPVSHWHTNTMTQTLTTGVYPWTVSFKLEENPLVKNELYLDVNIHLMKDASWGIAAQTFQDKVLTLKGDFTNRIVDAWSGRFAISFTSPAPGASFTRVIKIRVGLVDGTTPANQRYDVNVVAPAQSIDTSPSFTSDERKKARSYLFSDPAVQAAKQKVSSHLDAVTYDMGTWGAGDPKAIIHEFGHMIGNADEYNCTAFTVTQVSGRTYGQPYNAAWNAAGYANTSIMNNPGEFGRVSARHLEYVKHVYEAWKGVAQNTYQVIQTRA